MEHRWLGRLGLLATMIFVIAALLTGCKGKGGGYDDDDEDDEEDVEKAENMLDRVTDEELAAFNPDMPLSEGGGQSDAFKIHPLEEMIISAPAGAFDQNPDIQVSVASGQQLQAAEERLAEMMPDHELVWGYDIDAGLPSDSVLPGKYSVKIDLNRLGIPKDMQPHIRLVRMDDKGRLQPINSREKKGVICYEACQNSAIMMTVLLTGLAVVSKMGYDRGVFALPVRAKMRKEAWVEAGYPIGFWNTADLVSIAVNDDFGDFNVVFRFGKTERGDRTKEYLSKTEKLVARLEKLKKKAQKQYDKEHPADYYFHWLENAEQTRVRRLGQLTAYGQLLRKDSVAQSLLNDPDVELPQSVLDIIKATKLANRFSRDTLGLGMKPLSYTYNVYLVPQSEMGKGEEATNAKFQPLTMYLGGKVLVSYDKYLKRNGEKVTYDTSSLTATCVTMAHEIGHAFENEYINCIIFSNSCFFEAIGSVTEHWFAAWMKKKGYVKIANTESEEADKLFQYANRDKKLLLAWPLELDYPSKKSFLGVENPEMWGGYMLGDLVQFLCDNKKKVSFDRIMTKYAYDKSFLQDLKDIFDIKDNSEFSPLYDKFCFKFMPEIFESQATQYDNINFKNQLIPRIKFKPSACTERIENLGHNGTTKAYPFAVKVITFVSSDQKKTPYSLFAVPRGNFGNRELMFTFLEGDSLKQAKDSLFVTPCKKEYRRVAKAAIIYRESADVPTFDRDSYIDVVALYQPDKTPRVNGMSNDGTGLLVETRSKPSKELMQKGLITGMQLVVKNNKTGKTRGFGVPLNKCGEEVKVPYDKLGITDKTDVDVTIQSRWYYTVREGKNYFSPATDKVNYKRKDEQEEQNLLQTNPDEDNDAALQDESEEDLGGKILVDRKVRIKKIGDKGVRKDEPLYGRLVITKDRFVLTVPSYSWPVTDNTVNVSAYPMLPSIEMKGSCDMNFTDSKNFNVKFACSKIKPETITLESKGTFKDRGEPYQDYKCWSGGAKHPKHSELRVVNGHWPTFNLYAVMKLTVKSVWRTKIIDDSTYDNGVFEVCTEDEYDK